MRLKNEAIVFRRKAIIKLIEEGKNQQQVAAILDCSQALVSQTLKAYADKGEAIFVPEKRKGAVSRMTEEMKSELSDLLLSGALKSGFETDNWIQKRVQNLIQEKFGITYSVCYISRFLSKMSFSLQKPSLHNYKKVDEDAVEWRETTLPDLKKK